MKKLFLIPLMAMLCTVMAWADPSVRTASTIGELRTALSEAEDGDEIKLTGDINYGYSETAGAINVTKSITIDGQGHTLTGGTARPDNSGQYATIWVNYGGANRIDVTLKNLTIVCAKSGKYVYAVHTRGNIKSLTCENVIFDISKGGNANSPALQLGGSDVNTANVTLTNCQLLAKNNDYPLVLWVPANITAINTNFSGYCSVYFKDGSRGSSLNADACQFDAPNVHSGQSNGFAVFPMEDTPITFVLNNCGMNAKQLGDQNQPVFGLHEWAKDDRREGLIDITISGDNTYINCQSNWILNNCKWPNPSGNPVYGSNNSNYISTEEDAVHVNIDAKILGGTYSVNPEEMTFQNDWYKVDGVTHYNSEYITIPSGYEIKEIKTYQGTDSTTLYRVRKEITTSYVINDNAEGKGDGQNKNTEFIITGDGNDQSVGTATNDTVVANYIEVSNEATLTVADEKVLVVTNGMDVTAGAKVIAEAGSTIIIGEGGITSESSESIVIEADSTGSASFLLDPDVIVNTNPVLTVRMYVEAGKYSEDSYKWHRFAMPVAHIDTWTKENKDGAPYTVPTYLQRWDYNADVWASCTVGDMVPFLGYALTYDFTAETDAAKVTYVFKGNLCGNQDQQIHFQDRGFNFFGNSYTAYVDARTLLQGVIDDENVGGTVYLWDAANQKYLDVTLKQYRDHYDELSLIEKEIAPMHTFILQKRGVNDPDVKVNYRDAIWNNPRYGNAPASAPARIQITDNASVRINVTSANGDNDRVKLYQNNEYTDTFDNGADATKFMNANHINLFVTVDDEDLASVATDNLAGKALSLKTLNDVDYTMSFSYVNGTQYAIRDLMTNIVTPMTEGNTYTFVAQPNTTIEGRFVIVPMQNMPTDVETIENATAIKGIYTIMGQYVGETSDWETLPAGVYVIDGVKVVK